MSTCEFGTKFDTIFNMVSLRMSTCEFGKKFDMYIQYGIIKDIYL